MVLTVVTNSILLVVLATAPLQGQDLGPEPSVAHQTERKSRSPELPRIVTEQGHFAKIYDCIFLRDDRNIVTGGEDKTAILWDRKTGRELRRFEGHSFRIRSLAVDRSNRFLLTGSVDGTAKLWDVSTGIAVKTFQVSDLPVVAVQFSPDGQKIFTVSLDGKLRIWVTAKTKPIATFDIGVGEHAEAAFSQDGSTLVVASDDNTAKVFEPASGSFLRPLKSEPRDYYPRAITNPVSVSDDGSLVAILSDRQEGTRIYDVRSGEMLWQLSHDWNDSPDAVAFDRQNARILALRTRIKPGHDKPMTNAELISANLEKWDQENGEVEANVYDARTGHPISHSVLDFFSPEVIRFDGDGSEALIGDLEGSARLLTVPSLHPVRQLKPHTRGIKSVAASRASEIVVAADGSNVLAWDLEAGILRSNFGPKAEEPVRVRFNSDGSRLIVLDKASTHFWDTTARVDSEIKYQTGSGTILAIRDDEKLAVIVDGLAPVSRAMLELAVLDPATPQISWPILLPSFKNAWGPVWPLFAPDGQTVFAVHDSRLSRLNTRTKAEEWLSPEQPDEISSMSISHDGNQVLTGGWDHTATLWDTEKGKKLKKFVGHAWNVESVALSLDGQWVATGSGDKTAKLWDPRTGKTRHTLTGHQDGVTAVEFVPNSDYVATGSEDGSVRLWDVNNGVTIATLIQFDVGHWAIVAPDGRFDTNDLDNIWGLHWVFADDPFNALAPEIYMRDFYEPKLLPRLLKGKSTDFKPLPPLQSLNRAQPKITSIRVSPPQNDQTVTVEVDVDGGDFVVESTGAKHTTGVYDLRLLRDGQLVGEFPEPKNNTPTGMAAVEMDQWRKDTCVTPFGTPRTIVFRSVHLPHRAEAEQVEFAVYAFNQDRVKSPVGKTQVSPLSPEGKKKAYIVSVGVNDYGGSGWDLRYGAKDARRIADVLYPRLRTGGYATQEITTLVSDDNKEDATRQNISEAIEHVAKLSTPDDLVIVFFSGHGYSDEHSAFYLLPSDSRPGRMNWSQLSPNDLGRFISAEDLSRWLQNMVASEIVLIIDACHSAASVESEGFKPGPLGAKGLGQLAYDKRMRVLAASQTDQSAREMGGQIGEGVLTYALLHDGLEAKQAADNGSITIRSWLEYPINRVPELFKEIESGSITDFGVPITRDATPAAPDIGGMKRKGAVQVPALFDFARSEGAVTPGPRLD
jgi:WD40 repeat protein